MKKRIISAILTVIQIIVLCSCTSQPTADTSSKLKITATVFAHYDFARNVAGDLADVTLLLKPGVEVHTYEPSPADIIKINESDLFIYTGEHMESWAKNIMQSITSDTYVLDISRGIELKSIAHKNHANDIHSHQCDPHIWTSPANAVTMVENIKNALCETDPEHSEIYSENAKKYIEELNKLDKDFADVIASSEKKKLMFGGRFAMLYFTDHYSLDYMSAYDSCASEAEPGAKLIAQIIDEIKHENIGAVYYEEMSSHTVADKIAAETGAEPLLLHACHNVSKNELENDENYLSLMRGNLENIKKGLN